jgi:iron complex outermembrane receptor protein
MFKLRSYVNATAQLEFDAFFRYVGALPEPAVDAYSELDVRAGYRLRPGWDLSLIGNNLLHARHLEFLAGTPAETYERSVTLRSVWRF